MVLNNFISVGNERKKAYPPLPEVRFVCSKRCFQRKQWLIVHFVLGRYNIDTDNHDNYRVRSEQDNYTQRAR